MRNLTREKLDKIASWVVKDNAGVFSIIVGTMKIASIFMYYFIVLRLEEEFDERERQKFNQSQVDNTRAEFDEPEI